MMYSYEIGESLEKTILKIFPKGEIRSGDYIIIECLSGIEFNFEMQEPYFFEKECDNGYILTYDGLINKMMFTGKSAYSIYSELNYKNYSYGEMPFKIEFIDNTSAKVYLAPIPSSAVDRSGIITIGKPCYEIPLKGVFKTDENSTPMLWIDGCNTTISDSISITVALSARSSSIGESTFSISDVNAGIYSVDVGKITVRETGADFFKQGDIVTCNLSEGYRISSPNLIIKDNKSKATTNVGTYDNYFEFEIPKEWIDNEKLNYFTIENLQIVPLNRGKNYGSVFLTIKSRNSSLSPKTIKIAEFVYADGMEEDDGSNNISYTNERIPYKVDGGNIYFNKNTGEIVDADYTVKNAVIPSVISETPVKSIGNASFEGTQLSTIVLPDTITNIGDFAFKETQITNINLPEGVVNIGIGAFYKSKLKSFEFPNNIEVVSKQCFSECSLQGTLLIPENIKRIEYGAFSGCSQIERIEVSSGVTFIGSSAFNGCSGLTSVVIPKTVKNIGYQTFNGVPFTMVMYGHRNSIAEGYAKKYKILFMGIGSDSEAQIDTSFETTTEVTTEAFTEVTTESTTEITTTFINTEENCAIIELVPSATSIKAGDSLVLDVNISNNPGCAGFAIYVYYDTEVFSFVEKNFRGSFYTMSCHNYPDEGYVKLAAAANSDNNLKEDILWQLNFTVKEDAYYKTAVFSANVTQLFNMEQTRTGDNLPSQVKNGYVTIEDNNEKKSISEAIVTLSSGSNIYDGNAIKPSVTVVYGGKTLKNGQDYNLYYFNNVNAGTASIRITYIGRYSGEVEKTFIILPKSLISTDVNLSSIAYTYDGEYKQPDVTIKDGEKLLISDIDYTISCYDNLNAGLATIKIVGKGNYSGEFLGKFSIAPKSILGASLDLTSDTYVYNGLSKEPVVILNDGVKNLVKDLDYTVSYTNNTNVGKATVTVSGIGNYHGIIEKEFNIIQRGDVSRDGKVDSKDASVVLQHTSGIKPIEGELYEAGDTNNDKSIDSKDASVILQYTSGILTEIK
ncbi:MAG: leucine-rich repeat protein [Firmicutes bacterium]|nr:leucine-rich repeat protein [Bacillota bacterium]